LRVKICGITNIEDALICAELGADALGFIFYEKSKRYIEYKKAEEIIKSLPAFITKVGVFVEQESNDIKSVSETAGLTALQLHHEILPAGIDDVHLPVIKAVRVRPGFNFSEIQNNDKYFYLLDTYYEKLMGGTGESFDWEIIPADIRSKIILAGGISVKNLEYVFEKIKPQGVDLVSSLESSPGKKDKNKLKDFFNFLNELRYRC
jgi:phosphoribosylanthranilate isomerase